MYLLFYLHKVTLLHCFLICCVTFVIMNANVGNEITSPFGCNTANSTKTAARYLSYVTPIN